MAVTITPMVRTAATIADKDWVKRSYTVDPIDATATLIRFADEIDIAQAETLIALYDAAWVSSPVADGVAWDGTFAISSVVAEPDNARHCTIVQTLKLLRTPADNAALAALSYIEDRTNKIELPYSFPTVANSLRNAGEGESDTLTVVLRNLNPNAATETVFMDTATDANMVANFASGYTYITRAFDRQEDNTAVGTVVFGKMAWHSGAETSAAKENALDGWMVIASSAVAAGRRASATRIWPMRTLAVAVSLMDGNAAVNFVWPAGTTYVHTRNRMVDHHNGAYSVIQVGEVGASTEAWIDGTISFHVDHKTDLRTLANGIKEEYQQNEKRSSIQGFLTNGYTDFTPGSVATTNLRGTSYRYHGKGRYSARRVRRA